MVDTYEGQGPWPLVGDMRGLRSTLYSLLRGRQSLSQRRELFVLAGRVSGLLSYMAVNMGRPVLADSYATEAAMLAGEADDAELQMWVLGTRSFGLYYQGRYDEADSAAAAGVAIDPSSPQAIRLLINGRARALARIETRKGEAERMIGEALALSDRTEGLPSGMSSCIAFGPYSPARTTANAVTAFLSLGKSAQVLHYADQVDELVEGSDSRWSKALVRLDVASALLAQPSPEVERAMTLGREALEVTAEAPIRSVSQRARELANHAGRWAKHQEAAAYRQRLLDWHAEPLAHAVIEEDPGIRG
ncbi:hypothetical protein [Actinocorallia longicatena]|uniref:hypothetical protein n=1 Tax=Actinocorallia longicatena TaxID=111803 RepID=UPI0031E47C27